MTHEDELPEMTKKQYAAWFALSWVDFVRCGPDVDINGDVIPGTAVRDIEFKQSQKGEWVKYRKKPVEIEALQWDGTYDGALEIREKFPEMKQEGVCNANGLLTKWVIKTLEGEHIVSSGDFIIKGVKGEFYPCKSDIFKLTYDEVKP